MKHATDSQLSALLDQVLDAGETEQVLQHCSTCPRCQARLDTYHRMHRLIAGLPVRDFDIDAALSNTRARIVRGDHARLARRKKRAWQHPAMAIAAAALIAIAVLFALPSPETVEDPLDPKATLTQGPVDNCVAEQETDDIIRGYQNMTQLYYF